MQYHFFQPRRAARPDDLAADSPPASTADATLTTQIVDALNRAAVEPSSIAVSVEHGIVMLRGTVKDRLTKYDVENMVANLKGVVDIENQLQILPQNGATDGTRK